MEMKSFRPAFVDRTLHSVKQQRGVGLSVLLVLLLMFPVNSGWAMGTVLEKTVCGIKEPVVFWLWSSLAGSPKPARVSDLSNAEPVAFSTTDDRILRGYQLKAIPSKREPTARARGYLLVAQGNAMLADQILGSFMPFAKAGIDVYVFDYRGYGQSTGKRRLKAIVNDYREIIAHLDSQRYSVPLLYGMSFGGIVLLNALKGMTEDRRVVIDSTPSRLSDYGCPQAYDPVMNLPKDASNLLFIVGLRDHVVKEERSEELVGLAKVQGATVIVDPDMAHPFMDQNRSVHTRRIDTVKSFLLKEKIME